MKKIELIAIDPQYDFHDVPVENQAIARFSTDPAKIERIEPALAVPGAWEDSNRLARFIGEAGHLIDRVTVTLDSHQQYDISHPLFWKDANGNKPGINDFTQIKNTDVVNNTWMPVDPNMRQYALDYTAALEAAGNYPLIIWPPHCLIGTVGHNVVQPVAEALLAWEQKFVTRVNYMTKGHNPFTEHYGAFAAEVPIANDPTTKLSRPLIERFEQADMILLTGQALSHCVAATVRQLADNFGVDNVSKLVLLRDTTSPVPTFEQNGEDFVAEMQARGMRVVNTSDIKISRSELLF